MGDRGSSAEDFLLFIVYYLVYTHRLMLNSKSMAIAAGLLGASSEA